MFQGYFVILLTFHIFCCFCVLCFSKFRWLIFLSFHFRSLKLFWFLDLLLWGLSQKFCDCIVLCDKSRLNKIHMRKWTAFYLTIRWWLPFWFELLLRYSQSNSFNISSYTFYICNFFYWFRFKILFGQGFCHCWRKNFLRCFLNNFISVLWTILSDVNQRVFIFCSNDVWSKESSLRGLLMN